MGKQDMVKTAAAVLMKLPYEKTEFICNMILRVADNLGISPGVNWDTEKED